MIAKEKQTTKEKQGPIKASKSMACIENRNPSEDRRELKETLRIIFRAIIPSTQEHDKETIR